MRKIDRLAADNIGLLIQGADLTQSISDELFSNNKHEYFESGVGKHLRHVIDFYRAFLSGAGDLIRYDVRERNANIESQAEICNGILRDIAALIKELPSHFDGEETTRVSPEALEADTDLEGEVISSVNRELQYLIDHTIHHYAIIALTLRIQGKTTSKYFGYAPSTITYLESGGA